MPNPLQPSQVSAAVENHADPNALNPDRMTPEDRRGEVGRILAAGAVRLLRRKSSSLSTVNGESCLDFSPDQRGHAQNLTDTRA